MLWKWERKLLNYFLKMLRLLKKYFIEIILITISSVFSFWLMWHTFSYKDGQMTIAVKVWSDFASHIPLIRSFSFGNNFPPEFPLFSGELIRYHFLFYFAVGLLEKIGLSLDLALNLPSALSFTLLIITTYLLSKKLFKSKTVGILSVVFFLFNGSLSFLEFFKNHPISSKEINDIITSTEFPSFAPYGPGIVSAFWNLNIYTNQRHLALPLAGFLLLIHWLVHQEQNPEKKRIFFEPFLWGIFFGTLLYIHSSIFLMATAVLGLLFFLLSKQRLSILLIGLIGFIIALPRALFLKEATDFIPHIKFGYLITEHLTLNNFLEYWFFNLGLFTILLPIGFFYSSKIAKKILVAFFLLFIIGNTIQFSPEVAGNHKFFNAFVIVGNMFVAFAIVKLWKFHITTKIVTPVLIFFLILSGIIDFFPIKNDRFMTIDDYPKNPDISWIINHTPKDAVFLNSSYLYHPASLAGRKIFYGWPYFAWSLGYDTNMRFTLMKQIFNTDNFKAICLKLKQNKISYINTSDPSGIEDIKINYLFFEKNFIMVYKNPTNNLTIYDVNKSCSNF